MNKVTDRETMKKQIKEKYSRLLDDLASEKRHERVTIYNVDQILLEHSLKNMANNSNVIWTKSDSIGSVNTYKDSILQKL